MQQVATPATNSTRKVYSTVDAEYRALTEGAGLVDRSDVGRLSVSGEDAIDLLNRLSTNELMTLEVGKGIPTILTTNKGRIADLLYVYRLHDRLFVMTSTGNQQRVAEWIDFYTFVEDVTVDDPTPLTKMFSVVGPDATTVLDDLTEEPVSSLEPFERLGARLATADVGIFRNDFAGLPRYDVVIDKESGEPLRDVLTEAGATPVGRDALEAVRIERGVPSFGQELTEDYNPHEANLVNYVSFAKGCYIGQEVVARLQTYKKVQKYLVGLRWSVGDLSAGSKLMLDGKQVGVVTSTARSPITGDGLGLGYVRKELVNDGAVVSAEEANDVVIKTLV